MMPTLQFIAEIAILNDKLKAAAVREARAAEEIRATRAMLRIECAEAGCNDWPDDLHLADVVEKYLARTLFWEIDGLEEREADLVAAHDEVQQCNHDLHEENAKLRKFWERARDNAFEGCDMDGGEIQEVGLELGLLRSEPYDPIKHGDHEGFEEGDTICVDTLASKEGQG